MSGHDGGDPHATGTGAVARYANGASNGKGHEGGEPHTPAATAPAEEAAPPTVAAAFEKYRVEEVNRALVALVGRPRTVLDVGCGVGLNGAAIKRTGARVTGLEIVPKSVERARAVLDEVISADITSDAAVREAVGARRFDLIVFADVLEHMVDPRAVLARFLPYLEEDGQILVSLPNVAAWTVRLGLLAGNFDYQQSGILDDTHLRFFTRKSAARLCESAGLEVLAIEQNPMLVRAAKDLILKTLVGQSDAPTALSESWSYKAYQAFIRPLEDLVANRAPGLFAFQNVLLTRKPPRKRKMSVTIGMLTMDEEESIEKMIGEIRRVAPDAKLLCVDSSMKDKTPEIARRLGAKVLRQVPPRGHGPAMELLMYSAAKQSDMLIYLDCDFTYPVEMIPTIRRLIEEEGVDVVNCARTRTRPAAMPVPNFMANRAFAALAHVHARGAHLRRPQRDARIPLGHHPRVRLRRGGRCRPDRHAAVACQVRVSRGGAPHRVQRAGGAVQAAQTGGDGMDDDPAGEDAAGGAAERRAVRGAVGLIGLERACGAEAVVVRPAQLSAALPGAWVTMQVQHTEHRHHVALEAEEDVVGKDPHLRASNVSPITGSCTGSRPGAPGSSTSSSKRNPSDRASGPLPWDGLNDEELTMSHVPTSAPHFLRVVRALVRASGPAVPLTAIVTAVSSCGPNTTCGAKNGFEVMSEGEGGGSADDGEGGHGGATTTRADERRGASEASGDGGHGGASTASGDGGYGGR